MTRPIVIGYGNTLRQDDGVGVRAAELTASDTAEVIVCHQLTPELAAALTDASFVLFLDAALDRPCGSVRQRELSPRTFRPASHHFGPEQLLDLAATINGSAPRAFLITGGVASTDIGEGLTADGERCAQEMAGIARELIGSNPPGHVRRGAPASMPSRLPSLCAEATDPA